MVDDYVDMFKQAFASEQSSPYPYQRTLATAPDWPELLNIPTGLGKTAAVTLAWLYKRGWRQGGRGVAPNPNTPRRLIWCLPMRVLVEQTESTIHSWLERLCVLGQAGDGRVSVHVLMGGELDLTSWAEYPEEDAILIGTQDMLLSRALMRGYGMSRYQWPVHFALLHNDCLWAYDEVQLMGAGLATSAQLEAFRRAYPSSRSSRSLWLSATLRKDWLATVDLAPQLPDFTALTLSTADRKQAGVRLDARKAISRTETCVTAETTRKATGLADYAARITDAVLAQHQPDTQTLIILNRVDRAQEVFRCIQAARSGRDDLLVHARFRPSERAQQNQRLEQRTTDRIIVATQAIEAGVDISSRTLFTELAPWASLVQRLGRCNRYGEHNASGGARVFWIDIEDEADPLPYTAETLQLARVKLSGLTEAGPAALPATDEPRPLSAVLRRRDLLDLFNTDPDLSGFDVDISDYIRDSDSPGIQVFWRDVRDPNDSREPPARREELCPASLSQAKDLHKHQHGAWRWDSLGARWQRLDGPPRPGMTVLLAAADGGYDLTLGLSPSAKEPVEPLPTIAAEQNDSFGADWRSRTPTPIRLQDHLRHVAEDARALCAAVGETVHAEPVIRAGRWHDLGKAHAVFDQSMHRCPEAPSGLLAKSNCPGPMHHARPHFRHELASALAWLAQHEDPTNADTNVDLIAYLIAAHHGKVRMSLRAMPTEQAAPNNARYARGVWEGDHLPALTFDGEASKPVELKLALMELGEGEQGRSWTARTLALLEQHGPFRLAWLESLVRLADWRASATEQLIASTEESPVPAYGEGQQ